MDPIGNDEVFLYVKKKWCSVCVGIGGGGR